MFSPRYTLGYNALSYFYLDVYCFNCYLVIQVLQIILIYVIYEMMGGFFLVLFMQDKQMLKSSQRLVAYAILYQAYPSQKPSSNPFISLLVDVSDLFFIFTQSLCLDGWLMYVILWIYNANTFCKLVFIPEVGLM